MQEKEIIKKIIEDLKKIKNKDINILAAIECLERSLYNLEKKGVESQEHILIRNLILNYYKGNIYHESKETGFSKEIGFRPDIIILNEKELVIIEIETNKKRAERKLNIIKENYDKIKNCSLSNRRKILIVFCLSFYDQNLIEKIKKENYIVYILENGGLIKI